MAEQNDINAIRRMIDHLVGACDGAQERDDQGFNAADAFVGRLLAAAPDSAWATDDQGDNGGFPNRVATFIRKYWKQLEAAGFDTAPIERLAPSDDEQDDAPAPADLATEIAERGRQITLNSSGEQFVMQWHPRDSYFHKIKDAVKRIPGRDYDNVKRCWYVPIKQAPKVAEVAGEYLFNIDSDVAKTLERAEKIAAEAARADEEKLKEAGYTDLPDNAYWSWRAYTDDAGSITLEFPAPFESNLASDLKDEVKDAGGKFDRPSSTWSLIPGTNPEGRRDLLGRLASEYGIAVHPDVWTTLDRQAEKVKAAREASEATSAEIEVPGLNGTLRPFQRAGVAYTRSSPKALIADEMGLGKTIQAIATIHDQDAYPAIVVCPSSVVQNWRREVKDWLPNASVTVLEGTTEKARTKARNRGDYSADVIVASYDVAKGHEEPLASLGAEAVILDEAHAIKNAKAQRSKSAKRIAKQASVRLLLTGTPVLNRPAELIEPLKALDKLDALGGFWGFAERYCDGERTRFGLDLDGAKNLDELADRLRKVGFVRRRKGDVLSELPAKQRTIIDAPIPNADLKEHKKAAEDAAAYADEIAANDEAKRQELIQEGYSGEDLQQAMAEHRSSAEEKARRAELLVAINKCRQISGRGKVDHAVEFACETVGNGHPLVLFGVHKEVLYEIDRKLRDAGITTAIITGDQNSDERQHAVDQFQHGDHDEGFGVTDYPDVLLGTISAMGEGLTLTRASHVALIEQAWRPADHDQAEDRLHRIGQESAVNVYYLLDDRTIDSHMAELIESKRSTIDKATGDAQAAQQTISTFDIARKLGGDDANASKQKSAKEKDPATT